MHTSDEQMRSFLDTNFSALQSTNLRYIQLMSNDCLFIMLLWISPVCFVPFDISMRPFEAELIQIYLLRNNFCLSCNDDLITISWEKRNGLLFSISTFHKPIIDIKRNMFKPICCSAFYYSGMPERSSFSKRLWKQVSIWA